MLSLQVSNRFESLALYGFFCTYVDSYVDQAYVYVKAGAGAQATFSIVGLAEAEFNSERLELVSFGFPGLYYPGLLTIGPSLHLYGQLTGHLSFSGKFSTSVGYDFPVRLTFASFDYVIDLPCSLSTWLSESRTGTRTRKSVSRESRQITMLKAMTSPLDTTLISKEELMYVPFFKS